MIESRTGVFRKSPCTCGRVPEVHLDLSGSTLQVLFGPDPSTSSACPRNDSQRLDWSVFGNRFEKPGGTAFLLQNRPSVLGFDPDRRRSRRRHDIARDIWQSPRACTSFVVSIKRTFGSETTRLTPTGVDCCANFVGGEAWRIHPKRRRKASRQSILLPFSGVQICEWRIDEIHGITQTSGKVGEPAKNSNLPRVQTTAGLIKTQFRFRSNASQSSIGYRRVSIDEGLWANSEGLIAAKTTNKPPKRLIPFWMIH